MNWLEEWFRGIFDSERDCYAHPYLEQLEERNVLSIGFSFIYSPITPIVALPSPGPIGPILSPAGGNVGSSSATSVVTVAELGDQSNTEGDSVSLQASATDLNNLSLTFSADGLPTGLSINEQSGLITGTIAAGAANNGPYWTTIAATDGTSTDAQSFNWNVASPVSVTPLADQQNTEGDVVALQAMPPT